MKTHLTSHYFSVRSNKKLKKKKKKMVHVVKVTNSNRWTKVTRADSPAIKRFLFHTLVQYFFQTPPSFFLFFLDTCILQHPLSSIMWRCMSGCKIKEKMIVRI